MSIYQYAPRTFLKNNSERTYNLFQEKNPDFPHTKRTLEKLRPDDVEGTKLETRAQCCCIIHVAVTLVVCGLNIIR